MFLQMPNIRVFCPAGISEMKHMFRFAVEKLNTPVAIRYPRGGGDMYSSEDISLEPKLLKAGGEIAIVTYGRLVENAVKAAEFLDKNGVPTSVIKLTEISNLSYGRLSECLNGIRRIFVVEECVSGGSVASILALELQENDTGISVNAINIGSAPVPHATAEELMELYGLDAKGLANRVFSVTKKQTKTLQLIG
jgi:1-deoxy-D-xylulose-5-phosphate synthase